MFLDDPGTDKKETRPPSPPEVASNSKEEGSSSRELISHYPKNDRIASADSMEEMERRFEKVNKSNLYVSLLLYCDWNNCIYRRQRLSYQQKMRTHPLPHQIPPTHQLHCTKNPYRCN